MGANSSKNFLTRESRDLIVTVNGEKFSVDKSVLALHSSVFSKMLDLGPRGNELVIDDVDIGTMREIIRFMYETDTNGLNEPEIIVKVLIAAKNYDIQDLTAICKSKLKEIISNDNAIEILRFGINSKDADITSFIVKTIVRKSLPVIKSNEMKEVYGSDSDVLSMFIHYLYDNQRRGSSPIQMPGRKCVT